MANNDEAFMGAFIVSFSLIGCAVAFWCSKECKNKPLKKSPSLDNLQSANPEDPQIIV